MGRRVTHGALAAVVSLALAGTVANAAQPTTPVDAGANAIIGGDIPRAQAIIGGDARKSRAIIGGDANAIIGGDHHVDALRPSSAATASRHHRR